MRFLVVEMHNEGGGELVERCRQCFALDRRPSPSLQQGAHPLRALGDHLVLLLHADDQLRLGCGALQQPRPDVLVLAAVVVVEAVEQEVEMLRQSAADRAVAPDRGLPNQLGHHREPTAEDPMDHRHFLGPSRGGGTGFGRIGGLPSVGCRFY